MKYRILSICVLFSLCASAQTKTTKPTTAKPKTPAAKQVASNTNVLRSALDSFSYAMGMSVGNFCNQQGVTSINTAMLLKGVGDGTKKQKPLLNEQQANQVISSYLGRRNADKAAAAKAEGARFLAENAKKPGVVTLPSGLQYLVLQAGSDSIRPQISDVVKCRYVGTLINGLEFDGSDKGGTPTQFKVSEVIDGWIEALQLMNAGSKWRLFVPSSLGYGDQQVGPKIPPGSTLIFELELVEVVK